MKKKKMIVNVKDGWEDVTISDYHKIIELMQGDLNNTDVDLELLAILTDLTREQAGELTLDEVQLIKSKMEFLDTNPVGSVKNVYSVKDNNYVVSGDIGKYEVGKFVDIMKFTKDEDKIIENIHYAIACILTPIKMRRFRQHKHMKYNKDIPVKDIAEDVYNNMVITDALGIVVFFWNLFNLYNETTVDYSNQKMKDLKNLMK